MFRAAAALVVTAATLTGCAQEEQLYVGDAWVRLAAVDGRPAAAYFTIHGGPTDATLLSVSTEVAVRTELHESKAAAGGGMTMDAVRQVAVPALQEVRFAPAGRHAMLFDVNPAVKPGGTLPFIFTFADGTRIEQTARVIAAGDPAPAFK
ncbi:copper chaperone PCu(A)C [Sphingomonas radiodurans]|uniref:copper chaperone PCu(A)C n=1 Tax=Sphingomonas radiodurans TaxID=2890321 RepID=UPI001E2BA73A|nr:copper chaperone PCu(A)C [Sphingomonas radiodurans]WBH16207.1 copper chaperone PCu(A)C [Sphingomonas radiodurans]